MVRKTRPPGNAVHTAFIGPDVPRAKMNAMGARHQGDPESVGTGTPRRLLRRSGGGALRWLIEGVGEPLACRLKEELAIPPVIVSASPPVCDGQVLGQRGPARLSGEQCRRMLILTGKTTGGPALLAEDHPERRFPEASIASAMCE